MSGPPASLVPCRGGGSCRVIDATRYVALHHLEGDFPGGVVDLRYEFTLRGDLIERLVIEAA